MKRMMIALVAALCMMGATQAVAQDVKKANAPAQTCCKQTEKKCDKAKACCKKDSANCCKKAAPQKCCKKAATKK